MPGLLAHSGGRNGEIRLSMLRWYRASDFWADVQAVANHGGQPDM